MFTTQVLSLRKRQHKKKICMKSSSLTPARQSMNELLVSDWELNVLGVWIGELASCQLGPKMEPTPAPTYGKYVKSTANFSRWITATERTDWPTYGFTHTGSESRSRLGRKREDTHFDRCKISHNPETIPTRWRKSGTFLVSQLRSYPPLACPVPKPANLHRLASFTLLQGKLLPKRQNYS